MITLAELREAREWSVHAHRSWKQRSWVTDMISRNEWSVVWDDLTVAAEEPLVENIFTEALEDKASTAASLSPRILVAPSVGTRKDQGEINAQKKRRVFVSIQQRSNVENHMVKWYMDWWQHGARYVMPWCVWDETPRNPYLIRMDPRQAFPLSHDSLGNLTSILFARIRRLVDIQQEWGADHPTVVRLKNNRYRGNVPLDTPVEEIWYYDTTHCGVAIYDDHIPIFGSQFRYVAPVQASSLRDMPALDWLTPLYAHKLDGCPVIENKRHSIDGEYRGALDNMLPNLRVAQNLTARMLEDIEMSIYAPVLLENLVNPEAYGPGAHLIGDGSGNARIEHSRPTSNIDASIQVSQQLEAARNVARYPQQRQGDFGASIASAKGVTSVMGAFNNEIAWAQRDQALMLSQGLSRAANFDAIWCGGSKRIDGFDEGEMFSDTYDANKLWKNDYRVHVTFGGGLGMDQNGYLLTLATSKNLEGMSKRSFITKSGLVDNALNEEREIIYEQLTDAFLAFAFKQADEAGNLEPLLEIATEMDKGDKSARVAIMDVIKKTTEAVATGAGGPPGPPPGTGAAGFDPVMAARSLSAGGQPGSAAGLPPMGGDLSAILPPDIMRVGSELAPGGTAA